MKKNYLMLLLFLFCSFVYSSQVKYDNAQIVTWTDLNDVDYSVIYEDEGKTVIKLSTGEIVVVVIEE